MAQRQPLLAAIWLWPNQHEMGTIVARRRGRVGTVLIWWFWIALVGALAWYRKEWGIALLAVGLWGFYELFFCPTTCAAQTKAGTPCERPVHGRLVACNKAHQRIKNDGVWSLLARRSNPFARFRATWARSEAQQGWIARPVPGGAPNQQTRGGPRDALMLALTVISTAATVAGTWLTYLNVTGV